MQPLDPNTPAARPPLGVLPNFQAPSRAVAVYANCVVITALMLFFVALRIYSRISHTKKLASDDYTCLVAAVVSTGFTVVTILSTAAGFGRHEWDSPISIFTKKFFLLVYAIQGMYSPIILIVKISLFLLYFRIFSTIRSTRKLLYFGIAVNSVFYMTSMALVLYLCGPGPGHDVVQSFDDHRCVVDARNLGTAQASFNIASDIYLLCVPMPVLSNLQLSRKKKVGVGAIFMTGSFAVICSILNLYYRIQNGKTLDFTWAIPPVYITSVVEINVGIMCGCFPALPPVLRRIHGFFRSCSMGRPPYFTKKRTYPTSVATSESKKPSLSKLKITIGSRVDGKGHFLTNKSLFGFKTTNISSSRLALQDNEPTTQSSQMDMRNSRSTQDAELGMSGNFVRVQRGQTSV